MNTISDTFPVTIIPWRNHWDESKGAFVKKFARKGKVTSYPAGSVTRPQPNGRSRQEREQPGALCAPHTGLLVAEADSADFPGDLAETLTPNVRSARGFHYWIDARDVAEEDWPSQGPIRGGDVKSAGFVPLAGCEHWSGVKYEALSGELNKPTPALIARLRDLRAEEDKRRAERERERGHGARGHHDPGAPGGLNHHMLTHIKEWIRGGVPREEAWEQWQPLWGCANPAKHREEFERVWASSEEWHAEHWGAGKTGHLGVVFTLREEDESTSVLSVNTTPYGHVRMPPREIDRKRRAEATHIEARDHRRRMKSQDWKKAPAGCWNFYDLLMSKWSGTEDIGQVARWIKAHDQSHIYVRWLLSKDLIAWDGPELVPLPDKRPGCDHDDAPRCLCRFPGWFPFMGAPEAGDNWTVEEGASALLPFVLSATAAGKRLSRAQFAVLMQQGAHRAGKRAVTRAMVGLWLKRLEGKRRERIPGSRSFVWSRDFSLTAHIHVADTGFSYRRNHRWAFEAPLFAAGPSPDEVTPAMLAWAKAPPREPRKYERPVSHIFYG